jgi:hypothetical protein
MIAGKPIDHILAVADVHQRERCTASFETARFRLLGRILVRSKVSAGRSLRKCLFTRSRGLFEAVRPQRLMLEVNGDLGASFFTAGRFGSRWL